MARPSKYRPEFVAQAEKLCALGATDLELADFFGVDVATLYRWKISHPEFCESIKAAKVAADERVERSLYARATGYTHDAVKLFCYEGAVVEAPYREHVPPDTGACAFWLKNRRPSEWRDRQDVNHSGSVEITKIERVVVDAGGAK
jgi:hypothetical protein